MTESIDFEEYADESDNSDPHFSRPKRGLVIGAVVVVIAAATTVFFATRDSDESSSEQSYSGDIFSSGSDFSIITERNQEGFKVDKDGFIPISNDGGPLSLPVISENSTDDEITDAICTAANDLVNHRSKENRSEALDFMKSNAPRITFEPLKEAVDATASYELDDESVFAVLRVCE